MAESKTDPRFFAAIAQARGLLSRGPVNSTAIAADHSLVLTRASNLLAYQNYLSAARSRKASSGGVPSSFELEVQAHASQALSDVRDLAASTLRNVSRLKQAGTLDQALDTWIAGVQAAGSVQAQDLWSEVINDPATPQLLKDHGIADGVWTAASGNMKSVNGRFFLQGGKLTSEANIAGSNQVRTIAFTRSATGQPRTIHELLRRGQFDRAVDQFSQPNALLPGLVTGQARDVEIPDLMLAGAVQSVQLLAQHRRKLQDVGLATQAGNDPLSIGLVVGFLIGAIGLYLVTQYCPAGSPAGHGTACKVGLVLAFLAFLIVGGVTGTGLLWDFFLVFGLHEFNVIP